MKKLLLLLLITTTAAHAHTEMTCTTQIDDRCFPEVIEFKMNMYSLAFTYSSYYQMKPPYCGWPPGGFHYQGTGKYQYFDGVKLPLKDHRGNIKYSLLYFTGQNEVQLDGHVLNCTYKRINK